MAVTTGATARLVDGLHVEELGEDIVVSDSRSKKVHALSGDVAAVFRALRRGEAVDADASAAELRQLEQLGLLEAGGFSRRTLLRGATTVAVAGVALTIDAPMALACGSPGNPCGTVTALGSLNYNSQTTSQSKPGPFSESVLLQPVVVGGATPTGTVTVTAQDITNPSKPVALTVSPSTPITLSSGSASFTVANPTGNNSIVQVSAAYSGDANYATHTYSGQYTTASNGGTGSTTMV